MSLTCANNITPDFEPTSSSNSKPVLSRNKSLVSPYQLGEVVFADVRILENCVVESSLASSYKESYRSDGCTKYVTPSRIETSVEMKKAFQSANYRDKPPRLSRACPITATIAAHTRPQTKQLADR